MNVALVLHSLCENNVGRAYPFAQALAGVGSIQPTMVGWRDRGELFPLLRGAPWPIVEIDGSPRDPEARAALGQAVPPGTTLIHCFKNREHFPLAIDLARERNVPLLLDVDDWELGFTLKGIVERSGWRALAQGRIAQGAIANGLALEELARTAPDGLTVNSGVLQAYFGGTLVYTAADGDVFRVDAQEGLSFRARHGIDPAAAVVGFLGVPQAYKGIDDLIEAFKGLRRELRAATLLVTGVESGNAYYDTLAGLPGAVLTGYLPADAYPAAYAACDVIAIPQRARSECHMQTPAKLILGMAAGRAIVATSVGDIPAVLKGCGVLVPPSDPGAIRRAIGDLLADPARAESLGRSARSRFEEHFTLSHLRELVVGTYGSVLAAS